MSDNSILFVGICKTMCTETILRQFRIWNVKWPSSSRPSPKACVIGLLLDPMPVWIEMGVTLNTSSISQIVAKAPNHSKLQNHKNCDCDCYNNDINAILLEKNLLYVYFKGQESQLQEINFFCFRQNQNGNICFETLCIHVNNVICWYMYAICRLALIFTTLFLKLFKRYN